MSDSENPTGIRQLADGLTSPTDHLRCQCSGRYLPDAVVTSVDLRYAELTQGLNLRWVAHPDQVRLVTCAHHVTEVVQEAVDRALRITIRSGGHCYEDFVYNGETKIVLDLSELDEISLDPQHDAISVGAGASLSDVYDALYRIWGVTIPGGSCATVCAGGHIVGGGYGLLSRLHGLTVDHLFGVEVVVVDEKGQAQLVVATRDPADPHHDLWWAHTGGGGGNFGVVTRYLLRSPGVTGSDPTTLLPRPPAEVYLSSVALDWAQVDRESFTRLLRNFGTWHEEHSGVDSEYAGLFGLLKLNKQTRDPEGNPTGQIALLTQMDATRPDSATLLADYLAAVFEGVRAERTAWTERVGEHEPLPGHTEPLKLRWLAITQQLGGAPKSSRADYKSAYHRYGHTDEQIAATYEWLTTPDYNNPNALAQVDSYGCQVNAVATDATAVPQRDSVLKIQYQTYWDDPAEDAEHLAWIRGMYQDIYSATGGVPAPDPASNTDGCFVNYPDIDLSDPEFNPDWPWSTLYYKDSYPRLQAVKQRYDPTNVFHHTQSVEAP
jgi:FAD/FMN-containing dehydrogenase